MSRDKNCVCKLPMHDMACLRWQMGKLENTLTTYHAQVEANGYNDVLSKEAQAVLRVHIYQATSNILSMIDLLKGDGV